MLSDVIIIGLLIAALCLTGGKDVRVALIGYFCTVYYANSSFYYLHSDWQNHLIYVVIFVPFGYFANIRLGTAIVYYATFNVFVAIDYLIYPKTNTVLSDYHLYIHFVLALFIVLMSLNKGSKNGTFDFDDFADWVDNISYGLDHKFNFTHKKEDKRG